MRDKIAEHKLLCDLIGEIYRVKNEAYGDSFGKTFHELGIISAIVRMSDKLQRVISLTKGARNTVTDESLQDTLLDLANYALMTVIELDDLKKQ